MPAKNSRPLQLSVVMVVKNGSATIAQSLQSVKKIADEIIVVDMASTDDTVKIAKRFTSHVFKAPQDTGFVEPVRNWSVTQAKGDWVLVVDADEEVMLGLAEAIPNFIQDNVTAVAYWLPRQNQIFGAGVEKGGWWPDYQLRLFRRGKVTWTETIHQAPHVDGHAEFFPANPEAAILHHHYPSVSAYLERLDRYTTVEAKQHTQGPASFSPRDAVDALRQELLSRFFQKDGADGNFPEVTLAILQSLYQVAVLAKRWELSKNEQTTNKDVSVTTTIDALSQLASELRYWLADWHVQKSSGPVQWWWRLRRWLRV